jgi:hypothetical protein
MAAAPFPRLRGAPRFSGGVEVDPASTAGDDLDNLESVARGELPF